MEKFCAQCGSPIQPESKFCPNCGAPVHQSETTTNNNVANHTVQPQPQPAPTVQMPQAPQMPPQTAAAPAATPAGNKLNLQKDFFSITGRLNRLDYIKRFLILMGVSVLSVLLMEADVTLIDILASIVNLAVCVSSIMLCVRRLHDVDKSGFYWLLFLVPVANFYALYLIFFKDGTPGPNRYGV